MPSDTHKRNRSERGRKEVLSSQAFYLLDCELRSYISTGVAPILVLEGLAQCMGIPFEHMLADIRILG